MTWQRASEEQKISQVTPPEEVLDFIDSFPGLGDACIEHPSYLLSYAPQLALPDAAGWLQETINETYEWARDRVRQYGIDPDSFEGRRRLTDDTGYLVLRDIELVKTAPANVACSWAQGEIHGPPVAVHEPIDYAGWLASESSSWLGNEMRAELLRGIAEWGVWPTWREAFRSRETERLLKVLEDAHDPLLPERVRPFLVSRLRETVQRLGLNESVEALADRLLAAQFVEFYADERRKS